jgi:hypothetical protein
LIVFLEFLLPVGVKPQRIAIEDAHARTAVPTTLADQGAGGQASAR